VSGQDPRTAGKKVGLYHPEKLQVTSQRPIFHLLLLIILLLIGKVGIVGFYMLFLRPCPHSNPRMPARLHLAAPMN
jgi:hypothetical protein